MSGLHELLLEAARAAAARQRADGSLPPGCNGGYGDPETPVRNTSHWLVGFAAAWRRSGDADLRAAAEAALGYLCGEKARPEGASFWHRSAPGKDRCNGLVGQAWTLEALAFAADALGAESAAELGEAVFGMHGFDARLGLWRRCEIDGRDLGLDVTLNHQLWFAAAAAELAPHAGPEPSRRVWRFLDRLPRNLALAPDGIVRHWVSPVALAGGSPRTALRLWRARRRESAALRHKEIGYHAFVLHALARLRRHAPDHPFWRHPGFRRLWRAARHPGFRLAVDRNEYGWPYNPTGIEMAFALDVFEGPGSRNEQRLWLGLQLARHWDAGARALRRDTPDPETLAARLYEAVRLSDLELPPELDAPATAAPGR